MEHLQLYISTSSKPWIESLFITLRDVLSQKYQVKILENSYDIDTSITTIYMGINKTPEDIKTKYDKSIIIQLEQLSNECMWMTPTYKNILKRCRVWDFCKSNCKWLKENLNIDAELITFGYHYCYMLPIKPQTIGVLFYGGMSPRRRHFINILHSQGIDVHVADNNIWGETKKETIASSIIVINIHYNDTAMVEYPRLLELLAGGRFVISESSHNQDDFPQLNGGVVFTPINDPIAMAVQIKKYIIDGSSRAEIMSRGMKQIINLKNEVPDINGGIVKTIVNKPREIYSEHINLCVDIPNSVSSKLEEICFKDYFERVGGYQGIIISSDKPSHESVNLLYKTSDKDTYDIPEHSIILSFDPLVKDKYPSWIPNTNTTNDHIRKFNLGRIPYTLTLKYMCDVSILKTHTSNQFKSLLSKYNPIDYRIGLTPKILVYKYDGNIPYFTLLHALNHGIIIISDMQFDFEPFNLIIKAEDFPKYIDTLINLDVYEILKSRLILLKKISKGDNLNLLNFQYQKEL